MNIYVSLLLFACIGVVLAAYRLPVRRISAEKETKNKNDETTRAPVHQALLDYENSQYATDITIGTPAQTFTVVIDTTVSDLFIPGITCPSSQCVGKQLYNNKTSTTYHSNGLPVFTDVCILPFSDYCPKISGTVASDTVCIGNICVDSQNFAVISRTLNGSTVDKGILGLGLSQFAIYSTLPIVQYIIENYQLPHTWFTIWMKSLKGNPNGDVGGEITIGDYGDSNTCSSSCSWIPLENQTGLYQIYADKISIGSTIIKHLPNLIPLISDTGASFISGPSDSINQIIKNLVPDCDKYPCKVPCSSWGNLPPVVFTINNKPYPISSYNYIVQITGVCYLAFKPSPEMLSVFWIFGDVWAREYCQMFDVVNNNLGICKNLDMGFTTHSPKYSTPQSTRKSTKIIETTKRTQKPPTTATTGFGVRSRPVPILFLLSYLIHRIVNF